MASKKPKRRIAGMVFTERSVESILAGTKTRTMRIISPQPFWSEGGLGPNKRKWLADSRKLGLPAYPDKIAEYSTGHPESGLAFYWRPQDVWNSIKLHRQDFYRGDIAWIRERHKIKETAPERGSVAKRILVTYSNGDTKAIGGEFAAKWLDFQREHNRKTTGEEWRSPLFMPRPVSRAALKINLVTGHRIQAITEAQARAEGHTLESIRETWCQLHGDDAWERNDYVLAYSFELQEQPPEALADDPRHGKTVTV